MPSTAPVAQRPRHRRLAALAAAKSICDISQPPKMSPEGLASAGIAMARINGSPGDGEGDWGMRRGEKRRSLTTDFTDYTDYDWGWRLGAERFGWVRRASLHVPFSRTLWLQ